MKGGRLKILVVDDTLHVRNMLVDMLELDGFEVPGEASSGKQAIEMAVETDPDVIIMDYKMPGMDGLEAAQAIREMRPHQAVILYTAYLDEDLEKKARAAGVMICIGKAEGIAQLERQIAELARDLRYN